MQSKESSSGSGRICFRTGLCQLSLGLDFCDCLQVFTFLLSDIMCFLAFRAYERLQVDELDRSTRKFGLGNLQDFAETQVAKPMLARKLHQKHLVCLAVSTATNWIQVNQSFYFLPPLLYFMLELLLRLEAEFFLILKGWSFRHRISNLRVLLYHC